MSGGVTETTYSMTIYLTLADQDAFGSEVGRQIEELCADMDCEVSASSAMLDMSALSGSGIGLNIFADDMDVLQKAVMEAAFDLYLDFLRREAASGEYPVYKAYGMAYIRFAQEERALFKLLFMCDRQGQPLVITADREESISMIMQANGLSYARAEMLHLEMWACVHGIATMLVTSFVELDWQLISNMVTDVYQGARRHHMEMEAQQ